MANLRRDVVKQLGFLKGKKGAEILDDETRIAPVENFKESPVTEGYR